jgi:hypothetical protein
MQAGAGGPEEPGADPLAGAVPGGEGQLEEDQGLPRLPQGGAFVSTVHCAYIGVRLTS